MTPLVVTARLLEGFVSNSPIHLDALLAGAVAMREGMLLAPLTLADVKPIPLPLQRSECGRYWLASAGVYQEKCSELRHWHWRAPWVEYARLGDPKKCRRVQLTTGENKSYRCPYEVKIPVGGVIQWWAVGDLDEVRALLRMIHYLGKRRGSGKGRVAEWTVEPCETWGEGFPVRQGGAPLRNLPAERGSMLRLEPPYWMREGRVRCDGP